jgi:hypothetical protein
MTEPGQPAPRATQPLYTPVPKQNENDAFRNAVAAGTLEHGYIFAADGSPIDEQSFSPV